MSILGLVVLTLVAFIVPPVATRAARKVAKRWEKDL